MKKYTIRIVGHRVFLYPWLFFRQPNTLTEDIFDRTMIIWDPDKCAINDEIRIADYLGSKHNQ